MINNRLEVLPKLQQEILILVLKGWNRPDIALKLSISLDIVNNEYTQAINLLETTLKSRHNLT